MTKLSGSCHCGAVRFEVEEPEFVEHPHAPAHTAHGGARGLELAEDMVEDERTKL